MTERPIPFSAPMVRALLAGTKTQTRRVMKPQLVYGTVAGLFNSWYLPSGEGGGTLYPNGKEKILGTCPYGQPCDRLWVREAWRACRDLDGVPPRDIPPGSSIEHEATKRSYAEIGLTGKLRPSMFMPRWASRITLEITSVRMERLQNISEADAQAEGISPHVRGGWHWLKHDSSNLDDWNQFGYKTAALAFQALWEQINGPGSWEATPWVWVVGFHRIDGAAQ